jgi:transposase
MSTSIETLLFSHGSFSNVPSASCLYQVTNPVLSQKSILHLSPVLLKNTNRWPLSGYSGYDELFRTSQVTEVGCNAHARRKFEYAMDSDPVRAARMMVLWGRLYDIERRAKDNKYDSAQLLAARQKDSLAVFDEIKAVLNEYKDQVLPKSPMGKAIIYTLNQWDALIRYTSDPMLSIDNNLSERTLRMVVIGRKNYLFAGSEAGAKRAAIIYSLVASCKLNGHDPFAYFSDVLSKINTWPADNIDHLLPNSWIPPYAKAETASKELAA